AERVYRDPSWLVAAERFGRAAIESSNDLGSLCCGATGAGFAALALLRATGRQGWRGAAATALARVRAPRFPRSDAHSLYKGPLGAELLELELEAPEDALLPLFDQ